MKTIAALAALCLTAAGLPAAAQPTAAVALPPCMPQNLNVNGSVGFFTSPALRPDTTSRVSFVLRSGTLNQDVTLAVSRPDGSRRHNVAFTFNGDRGSLNGADTYPYRLADAGTWILYDQNGAPWYRYIAQPQSWFSNVTGPGRIVTAGETVTVRTWLTGWTAAGTLAPVPGMPMTTFFIKPAGDERVERIVTGTTRYDGLYALPFVAVSNRTLTILSNYLGPQPTQVCATHEATGATVPILVRKRITRTVSDSTPTTTQTVRIYGTVYPHASGQRVYLQRWNGRSFVTIANGPIGTTGTYAFSYRPATRGTHALRVFTPYDAWHVSSASPNAYLKAS